MLFNPDMETLPLEKLRKLQSERLKKLVAYVYKNVPFYKQQLDKSGIQPASINDIRDIVHLPFTRKEDLRTNYPYGLMAVPRERWRRIHASSGTTGKPTVVGYTKKDLDLFGEVNARSLAAAGARPGMMLHNAYGYGLFTGGLGLHAGAETLGMSVIPVSGGMTERQLMILKDFQPDVICCTPSYAQRLTEELIERSIDPSSLRLKYAVLGAEPWTEAIREDVEKGLQVKATNIYGLSEIIGPGVSQEAVEERGTGSHIWEDHFFPEIVDPNTGAPLPEGKEGVLVFTTLTKEAMPLIRYWTNDICSLHYDSNAQRTHIKMSSIKGRADDMLIIRGVNLFHTQVEELIQLIPELAPHYQLIVSREKTMDTLEVKVELEPGIPDQEQGKEQLSNHLQKKMKDNIGITALVSVLSHGKIPRSEGGKLQRIIDHRKQK